MIDENATTSDFGRPGRRPYPSGSSAEHSASLLAIPLESFEIAPPVTRLLYEERRLHFDFLASGADGRDGLALTGLGHNDMFPLRRIASQMRLVSMRAPASVRNTKKRSELQPYCEYLRGKKQVRLVDSLLNLTALNAVEQFNVNFDTD